MKSTITFLSLFIFAAIQISTVQANPSAAISIAADTLLNKPAPNFSLKDLNGKTVSLSDYKGKVLILDFWATWCVPCRDSFPAMEMVMNKYKNDPNVKFLFIDTREREANYTDLVKKFLKEHKYPFYVAFDKKGADGKMDVTFKDYVMPGIPTKYIIDAAGMIRFQKIGFESAKTTKMSADELSELIEASKTRI